MSLQSFQFDSIDKTVLERLVQDGINESIFIEYKTEVGLKETSDKIKFLKGVSSFGNTNGGDFLIGIRTENGIPVELVGISKADIDDAKLRMEQLIKTGLSPNLPVRIEEIRLDDTKSVILIRIPRSWSAPHLVMLGHDKFYGRHSAGSFPMDLDQIRAAFLFTGSVTDRIEKVRQERILTIGESPILAHNKVRPLLVLHIIPFAILDPSKVLDIRLARPLCDAHLLPFDSHWNEIRFNADGVLTYKFEGQGIASYCQLFRSGMVEAVGCGRLGGFVEEPPDRSSRAIACKLMVQKVASTTRKTLQLLQKVGVSSPLMITLSLLNTANYRFPSGRPNPLLNGEDMLTTNVIDRNSVLLPPVIMDQYEAPLAKLLRPILDALWNAGGWSHCVYSEVDEFTIAT